MNDYLWCDDTRGRSAYDSVIKRMPRRDSNPPGPGTGA